MYFLTARVVGADLRTLRDYVKDAARVLSRFKREISPPFCASVHSHIRDLGRMGAKLSSVLCNTPYIGFS